MAKRRRNAVKEKFWRRAVEDWRGSGLSVRAYCAQAGLSEPSFYVWRRELQRREPQRREPQRRDRWAASTSVPTFVPVQVLAETGAAIEIVLPQGAVVRVRSGFDRQTLQDVIAILAALAGDASC